MLRKIFALLSVAVLISCAPAIPAENVTPIQLSSSDRERVELAVKARLVDPESAIFGPSAAFSYTRAGVSYRGVCGYVKGRNRMGGYVDFQPYIAYYENERWWSTGPGEYYAMICRNDFGIVTPVPPTSF